MSFGIFNGIMSGSIVFLGRLQMSSDRYAARLIDYEARCHLSICLGNGPGSLSLDSVEERAPVHVGRTDTIVAIDVQRARIAAIVSIAQQFDATETALRVLPCTNALQRYEKLYKNMPKNDFFLQKKVWRLRALCTLFPLKAVKNQSSVHQNGCDVNASAYSQRNAPQSTLAAPTPKLP